MRRHLAAIALLCSHALSSAGDRDLFLGWLGPRGWQRAMRTGGKGYDGLHGLAVRSGRVWLAATLTGPGELGGVRLEAAADAHRPCLWSFAAAP